MDIDYRAYPLLYVDDEEPNLLAFEYTFGETFQVEVLNSPEKALRRLHEKRFGVLLADQRMPGMSGVELCVRARALCPDTVRLIVTAYSDLHAAIGAMNDGRVMRYIEKPYRNEELEDILKAAIEAYHAAMVVAELRNRIVHGGSTAVLRATERRIGHEVKNLLSPLNTNLQLMEDFLGMKAAQPRMPRPEQLDELLAELRDSVSELRLVYDRLSMFSEQLRGRLPFERGRFRSDLARLVEGSVRLARSHDDVKAPIRMVVEDNPHVDMEPMTLGQVVLNLLVNAGQALRHKSDGEVTVIVSTIGDAAAIRVVDNGPGVPEQNLERIFDPYFTTRPGGTGHGLAICRQHVEEVGGTLSVESKPNAETTFTIMLPVA